MVLNGGNQSVIIDLPGPLHSGSSVTTNEHPYIKIDIPSPTPEEQDCANLPLGRVHATLAVATPKTPWKPRITLTAKVDNLLTRGMTEDYNCEPEHSAMAKEPATETDTSPPQKMEVPVLPVDTSSQVSVPEMEASMESNPICDSPQQWHIAAAVTVQQWTSLSFRPMPTWLSIICFQLKGLWTLKGSWQFGTSRHCCTSEKLKKLLPMKEPRLST